MDCASLLSYLHELGRISDWLSPCIHIAPTARSESNSCFVEGLKDSQRAKPQGHERDQAQGLRRAREEYKSKEGCDAERHNAKCQALPATAWTDVGNLHYFNVCRTRTRVKSRPVAGFDEMPAN